MAKVHSERGGRRVCEAAAMSAPTSRSRNSTRFQQAFIELSNCFTSLSISGTGHHFVKKNKQQRKTVSQRNAIKQAFADVDE